MKILGLLFFVLLSCSQSKKAPVRKKSKLRAAFRGPTKIQGSHFKSKNIFAGNTFAKGTVLYSVDFNNDGKIDLVTLDGYSAPQFFKNTGKIFKKLSYNPLPKALRSSFLVFADFNKDGVVDLVTVTMNHNKVLLPVRPILYKGSLGKKRLSFTPVKNAIPLNPTVTSSMFMWDFNQDGLLDFYVANWWDKVSGKLELERDYILWGHKNGLSFRGDNTSLFNEERTSPAFPLESAIRPSFSVDACSQGRNQYVLTASTHGFRNRFWSYENKKFIDRGREHAVAEDSNGIRLPKGAGHTVSVVCDFLRSNKRVEVFLGEQSHAHDPLEKDVSSFVKLSSKNKLNRRTKLEYSVRPHSFNPQRVMVVDFNGDQKNDLLVENTGYPPQSKIEYWQQTKNGFVERATAMGIDLQNPAGLTITDFNSDGHMDIISGQSNVRDKTIKTKIYGFQKLPRKNFLFSLEGRKSNKMGIGAVLQVRTSLSRFKRLVKTQFGGLPGQSYPFISVPLRGSEKLLSVRVLWPYRYKKGGQLKKSYDFIGKKPGTYKLCENGKIKKGLSRCF